MKLLPDWKSILTKAWSVKFMVLAALLSGCEVVIPMLEPVIGEMLPKGMFAALSGVVTAGALVSRVLMQNEVEDATKE